MIFMKFIIDKFGKFIINSYICKNKNLNFKKIT